VVLWSLDNGSIDKAWIVGVLDLIEKQLTKRMATKPRRRRVVDLNLSVSRVKRQVNNERYLIANSSTLTLLDGGTKSLIDFCL
jgi:hypothetical protein